MLAKTNKRNVIVKALCFMITIVMFSASTVFVEPAYAASSVGTAKNLECKYTSKTSTLKLTCKKGCTQLFAEQGTQLQTRQRSDSDLHL